MLTITKYGKSLCYRKDGNKLGRRKEQGILTKALERSMLKHEINSYAGRMGNRINCCVVGAGMSAVPRYASIGSMGTGIITVNGIPYNSMDEFDRPVSDKDIAQCIDFQFNARKAYKVEYRLEEGTNTYKPLENDKLNIHSSAWDRLDKKLSGGFKQDELCFIGSYMSPEEFTGNPSLTMVSKLIANVNKNVVMVGLENQHDELVNAIVKVLKDKH